MPSFYVCMTVCLSVILDTQFMFLSVTTISLPSYLLVVWTVYPPVSLGMYIYIFIFSFQFAQVFSVLSHWTQMHSFPAEISLKAYLFLACLWVGSLDRNSYW